mmetsp:Transcript_33226/g.51710  ORF Transcript_33226/g.51710 Transcript_33226/m.51710 type:complete len:780 (+) Transcript_33226:133-2472(+)
MLVPTGTRKVCQKAPDDRCFEDCEVLQRSASKCAFVKEHFSQQQIPALYRCAQMITLKAGQPLKNVEADDRVILILKGLLTEVVSGQEPKILKDGSVFLKFGTAATEVRQKEETRPLKRGATVGFLHKQLSTGGSSVGSGKFMDTGISRSTSAAVTPALHNPLQEEMELCQETGPKPEDILHTALQQCELMCISKSAFTTHVENWQTDTRGQTWMKAKAVDGAKDEHWKKVTCIIENGYLSILENMKGLVYYLHLDHATQSDPIAVPHDSDRFQSPAMNLAGFEKGGVFRIEFDRPLDDRNEVKTSRPGLTQHELHGVPSGSGHSLSSLDGVGAQGSIKIEHPSDAGEAKQSNTGLKGNDSMKQQSEAEATDRTLVIVASSVSDRDRWVDSIRYYIAKRVDRNNRIKTDAGRPKAKESTFRFKKESIPSITQEAPVLRQLKDSYVRLMNNRFVEIAVHLGSLQLFRLWSWRDLCSLAQQVQTLQYIRGRMIFDQDAPVKGLYIVSHGIVSLLHLKQAQEIELRFPGRDDLVMEEDLELKRMQVVRRRPIGTCGESACFGEEIAGPETSVHRFSLEADSVVSIYFIPLEIWKERTEDKKNLASGGTLEILRNNDANRSSWITKRVRHLKITRLFVDITKHRHLNETAFVNAARSVERLMILEGAIMVKGSSSGEGSGGSQIQHFDVEASEAASRKSSESLDALYRSALTPGQQNELKRVIGILNEELHSMLTQIRDAFHEQMQNKIAQYSGPKSPAEKLGTAEPVETLTSDENAAANTSV